MAEKILVVLTFIMIVFVLGVSYIEEVKLKEIKQQYEVLKTDYDELSKQQRITSQDVKFFEDMLKEISAGGK